MQHMILQVGCLLTQGNLILLNYIWHIIVISKVCRQNKAA